jgi:hypothetical protein
VKIQEDLRRRMRRRNYYEQRRLIMEHMQGVS